MIITQYSKAGEILYKKSLIIPTQEMQEILDLFWNTIREKKVGTEYSA